MTQNNYFDWNERFIDSPISNDTIDDLNIDESIDIDWEGTHSFGGGIDMNGGTLDDSSQGYIDLSSGNDLRLATGQAIEDGNGDSRVDIGISNTLIYDNQGLKGIGLNDAGFNFLHAYNGQPVAIRDQEGSFTAFQYSTDASAPGTLELTNAQLVTGGNQNAIQMSSRGNVSADIEFNTGATNDGALIRGRDESGTTEIKAKDGAGNTTTLT